MTSPTGTSKRWCFTINNPTQDETPEYVKSQLESGKGYKYLVFQLEAGSEGTPHYQGFVIFDGNRRFSAIRGYLPRAHWEKANGSSSQNRHYCTKPVLDCSCSHCISAPPASGGPWEYGSCPSGSGDRGDLKRVRDLIRAGKRKRDLIDDEDGLKVLAKYPRFVDTLYQYCPPQRVDAPEVNLLYGPSGCGKTRHARQDPDVWATPISSQGWFDGYDGHSSVLFDDFGGVTIPFRLYSHF